MKDRYKCISSLYNKLCGIYSLGAISRCRMVSVENVAAGEAVCFIGVGQGAEAVAAALLGAKVTVVDVSRSMLDRFETELEKASVSADISHPVEVVHADVCKVKMSGGFDVVVANVFLNVFEESEMTRMLSSLVDLTNQTGRIHIGDFLTDRETSLPIRLIQNLNWYSALILFRCVTDNAWHAVYDYRGLFRAQGWELERQKIIKILGVPLYHSCAYRCIIEN